MGRSYSTFFYSKPIVRWLATFSDNSLSFCVLWPRVHYSMAAADGNVCYQTFAIAKPRWSSLVTVEIDRRIFVGWLQNIWCVEVFLVTLRREYLQNYFVQYFGHLLQQKSMVSNGETRAYNYMRIVIFNKACCFLMFINYIFSSSMLPNADPKLSFWVMSNETTLFSLHIR